jgi:hypothetical protein
MFSNKSVPFLIVFVCHCQALFVLLCFDVDTYKQGMGPLIELYGFVLLIYAAEKASRMFLCALLFVRYKTDSFERLLSQ